MNFIKALQVLSENCEKDSADKVRYGSLFSKFENYFNSIADKRFYHSYLEKGTKDTLRVAYAKNELLETICSAMQDASTLKYVAYMITEITNGNHLPYIQRKLDKIFNRNTAPNGMRISVCWFDQSNYNNEQAMQDLWKLYPLLKGYHINDVYNEMCNVWQVPPVSSKLKQPNF